MNEERPNCLWCGQRLKRYIIEVHIPWDTPRDTEAVHRAIAGAVGGEYRIMDGWGRIWTRLSDIRDNRKRIEERQREAQDLLKRSHNEPAATLKDRHDRSTLEDTASRGPDDFLTMGTIRVRVWTGRYGPDGRGLFHAGTCAQHWANELAGRLRASGKV